MQHLRQLNFDDLILLKLLLKGMTLTAAARQLNLTQPAVTQRMRKLGDVFNVQMLKKSGRHVVLTDEGAAICTKAASALAIMEDLSGGHSETIINIGTRPEIGRSWLVPGIQTLRRQDPLTTFHLYFGSGEEILARLGIGNLDAVLTSAPITLKGYEAIELAKESYVMVAAPKIAKTIKKVEDLQKYTLIEHDRSFPFQRYVDSHDKAKLKYASVWFLGSTVAMTETLASGYGVGIVPEYLAAPYLKKKKLSRLSLGIKLSFDHFRLVFRTDRELNQPVQKLAHELRKLGLQ